LVGHDKWCKQFRQNVLPQVSSSKLALSRKAAKPVAVAGAGADGFVFFLFPAMSWRAREDILNDEWWNDEWASGYWYKSETLEINRMPSAAQATLKSVS